MTSYSRGDVVLVCFPEANGELARLRPAVVLHNTEPADTGISVVPLTPVEGQPGSTFRVERGTFEAARMGLISSVWLHIQSSFDIPLCFVEKRIGQCPYGLLDKAIQRRRDTLSSIGRGFPTVE